MLNRILFATRYTRHLDRHGYIRFNHWRLYGERGLAQEPVTIWISEGSLKIEHQAVTLAQYHVELQGEHKQVQQVSHPRLVETPFRSPQLTLFSLEKKTMVPLPTTVNRCFLWKQRSFGWRNVCFVSSIWFSLCYA